MLSKRYRGMEEASGGKLGSSILGQAGAKTAVKVVVNIDRRQTNVQRRNLLFEEIIAAVRSQESRLRKLRKGQDRTTERYVDADRAAAVVVHGALNLKSQISKRSQYDRINLGTTKSTSAPQQQQDNGDGDVAYKFGLRHMHKRDYAQALENFNLSVALESGKPKVVLARCRCRLALGQFPEALDDAEHVLQSETVDRTEIVKASLCKAEALFQLGQFEMAAVWYHRYTKLRPTGDRTEPRAGVAKSERAIGNTLGSSCFEFDKVGECLGEIGREVSEREAAEAAAEEMRKEKLIGCDDEEEKKKRKEEEIANNNNNTTSLVFSNAKKKRGRRRRSSRLSREIDQILKGKISTDKKFFLYIKESSALESKEVYQDIVESALDFIEERQSFWWIFDPKKTSNE